MSDTAKRAVFALWIGAALATAMMSGTSAQAAGAFALGLKNDDPTQGGIAAGTSWNQPTDGEAKFLALKNCLAYVDGGLEARVACKVVSTFHNQCIAMAFDKDPGTPGFGWSLGIDKSSAETSALNKCKATAGAGRAQYCVLGGEGRCDVTSEKVAGLPSSSTPLAAPIESSPAPQSISVGRR